ncbi:hypothetical protein BDN72DRAFT_859251 [Pluteus cervinus]|uniref:Uncharacterized protein n=1 Tax=Pluteus cervinus TaxID=181527 RepID=A0ACD3AP70_9AGAR|nr:hypothetical protein BDN72DRAFT_859251 [Pluteus cervinus]
MDSSNSGRLHWNSLVELLQKASKCLPSCPSCLAAFSTLLRISRKFFFSVCLFGLPTTYFHSYQVLPSVAIPATSTANTSTPWSQFLEKHKHKWQMLNIVSVLLLPLNVAFLQIESIAQWELTRTTTVLSLWLSGAGLVCGCINLFCLPRVPDLYLRLCANEEPSSLRFWYLWIIMALPAAFTIWSAVALVITVAIYSFVSGDSGDGTARRSAVTIVLAFIGSSMLPYLPVLRAAVSNRTSPNPQAANPAQVQPNAVNA